YRTDCSRYKKWSKEAITYNEYSCCATL
ncbi:hypothetical protein A5848_000080, partial [Enterococcus faecium]